MQITLGSIGILPKKRMFVPATDVRCSRQSLKYKDWNWTGSGFAGVVILSGTTAPVGNLVLFGMDD
jgi:hypothetical protein